MILGRRIPIHWSKISNYFWTKWKMWFNTLHLQIPWLRCPMRSSSQPVFDNIISDIFFFKNYCQFYWSIRPNIRTRSILFFGWWVHFFEVMFTHIFCVFVWRFFFFGRRYINPSFLSPETYGIISDSKQVTPVSRRNLILLTKVLQNLSNGVEFQGNKEPFMMVVNDYIRGNMWKMEKYFQSIVAKAPSTVPRLIGKKKTNIPFFLER